MGWFERRMGRRRWVDEDKGWVGGGQGQGMGRRSGLHATVGLCVEGWLWASLARMGLNKDGDLTSEDVLGFFRWSVLELSLFGCLFFRTVGRQTMGRRTRARSVETHRLVCLALWSSITTELGECL